MALEFSQAGPAQLVQPLVQVIQEPGGKKEQAYAKVNRQAASHQPA
jgi:hypothetical protein